MAIILFFNHDCVFVDTILVGEYTYLYLYIIRIIIHTIYDRIRDIGP